MKWLVKLQHIDRRWLYAVTFVLMVLPFVLNVPMPMGKPSATTIGLYEKIEQCAKQQEEARKDENDDIKEKIVLVDASWEMGSAAENLSQMECVIRHLVKKRIKFVVVSVGITYLGPLFADKTINPIVEEYNEKHPDNKMTYGKDWVNLGFIQGANFGNMIDGICRDLHKARPEDYYNTPVGELELMRNVHDYNDFFLIFSVTYCSTPDWMSFAGSAFGVPVAFGYMTIVHPDYSKFFDSGQLCGALVGNGGAAEYEQLIGHTATGTSLHQAGSFGNVMIILAAILGNLGAWAGARQGRRKSK